MIDLTESDTSVRSAPEGAGDGQQVQTTSVSFGVVQVREYNRISGNHPDVTDGPSLAIDWGFIQNDDVKVSKYERVARRKRCYSA